MGVSSEELYRLFATNRHDFMVISEDSTDVNIICLRGFCLYDGIGCTKNTLHGMSLIANVIDEIKRLSVCGDQDAQASLGRIFSDGITIEKDEAIAVEWYQKAAIQGNARAQNGLGSMYASGRGVEKDETVAVEWYRKAAEQGYARAQTNLGVMYANGRGVEKDEAVAVEWYRKAAEQGYAAAQNNLGWRYANGRGVEKDEGFAIQLYRKAAEQGYAKAQYNLGRVYETGRGVEKDERLAVEWYHKAAEQGYAAAQSNLGAMYANGSGVEKDEAIAVSWCRKAAEQGYATAQYNLGVMYANGRGVDKDEAIAVDWYREAAEQGYAEAQNNLGVMYENGRGVEKDEMVAVEWYRKAAGQGYAAAQNNLGRMYGRGIERNEAIAVEWYRKAAEHGNVYAQYNLGIMYANGWGVEKDESVAAEWYHKAATQGFVVAQNTLGCLYENGLGVGKDVEIAVEWYRKAASQGYGPAQSKLDLLQANIREAEANGSTAHLAYTLGLIGNLDDYPRLERLSHDTSGNTRRMVASALGKLACKLGIGHKEVINILCRLSFEDDCPQVRQYALKALMKYNYRQPEIIARVKAIAEDMAQMPYVRVAAAALLSKEDSSRITLKMSGSQVDTSNLIGGSKDDGISGTVGEKGTVTRGTSVSGQMSDVDGDASKQVRNKMSRPVRHHIDTREVSGLGDIDVELSHIADVLWVQSVSPGRYVPPSGWSIKSKEVIATLKPCRYLVRRQGVTHFSDRENYAYDFIATLASVKIDGAYEIHNVCFLPSQWDDIARQANVCDRIYIKAKWLEVPLINGWVSRSRGREYFRGRLIYPTLFRIKKCKTTHSESLPCANNLLALQLTGV